MTMNTELKRKVHEDYTSFFKELLYTNRFFCEGDFTEKIKELSYRVTSEILEGTFLYRARIMPNLKLGQTVSRDGLEYLIKEGKVDKNSSSDEFERCLKDLDIWGYNEKNSGMPPLQKTVDGRANPKFIPYLYVAQDKYTALVESKPYMGEKVSIATYKVVQTLKIFDISLRSCGEDADYFDVLNNFLSMKFSQPL